MRSENIVRHSSFLLSVCCNEIQIPAPRANRDTIVSGNTRGII